MGGPERERITAEEAKKYKYNPLYNVYTEKLTPAAAGEFEMGAGDISKAGIGTPIDAYFKDIDREFLANMAKTEWKKKKGPAHQAASFGAAGKFSADNALADATPWVADTAPSDYTKSIKGDIEGYLQKWRERHGYSS